MIHFDLGSSTTFEAQDLESCATAYRVRLGISVYMNKYVATLNSVVRCAILLDIPIQRHNSQPHHW